MGDASYLVSLGLLRLFCPTWVGEGCPSVSVPWVPLGSLKPVTRPWSLPTCVRTHTYAHGLSDITEVSGESLK